MSTVQRVGDVQVRYVAEAEFVQNGGRSSISWATEHFPQRFTHHDKRVLEYLLGGKRQPNIIDLWGRYEWAEPYFFYERDHLVFLYSDKEATNLMPDGSVYVKDPSYILFDIPAPTLSMKRGMWLAEDRAPLDRFAAPAEKPDPDGTSYQGRHAGDERFECTDWDKGFSWLLYVHDMRACLDGLVVRVHRSLWRRQVIRLTIELQGGARVSVGPELVEPNWVGRSLPRRGELVRVVLNDEGTVDRVWFSYLSMRRP